MLFDKCVETATIVQSNQCLAQAGGTIFGGFTLILLVLLFIAVWWETRK
jgi:hypothetical protein